MDEISSLISNVWISYRRVCHDVLHVQHDAKGKHKGSHGMRRTYTRAYRALEGGQKCTVV